jgi:hypothetical protein
MRYLSQVQRLGGIGARGSRGQLYVRRDKTGVYY